MSAALDELSPLYLGEDRIVLSLMSGLTPRAFRSIIIDVDYAAADPQGVVLPLKLIVQGPSSGSYQTRIFSRVAPARLAFMPREGGSHLVVLREVAHNRWFGRLRFTVDGPLLETPRPL